MGNCGYYLPTDDITGIDLHSYSKEITLWQSCHYVAAMMPQLMLLTCCCNAYKDLYRNLPYFISWKNCLNDNL